MSITLEEIEAEHLKLGKMIAEFKANANAVTAYYQPETRIGLHHGEHYAGIVIGKDGQPSYHLILLPGEADATWQEAHDFAKKIGGELPTRREQSLLFANLKEQFKEVWYWSSERRASVSDYVWGKSFSHGGQYDNHESFELRVRAVRRIYITENSNEH